MNNGSCAQGQVQLWSLRTGKLVDQPLFGHQFAVTGLAFSPDGQTVASSSSDGIILWNVTTRKPLGRMLSILADNSSIDYYSNILFSPNGKMLASYSSPGTQFSFVLWDVTQDEALAHAFNVADSYQGSIAFSPNGQQLASVTVSPHAPTKGIFMLWDITIESWRGHACSIANRNLTKDEWQQFVQDEVYSKVCPNLGT
jgi:WD40 repeat protein